MLFLILLKLYSMRREKDKWHLLIASFFLFVGGMATSTHVTVGLYLLGFMLLAVLVLARFAYLHMISGVQRSQGEQGGALRPRLWPPASPWSWRSRSRPSPPCRAWASPSSWARRAAPAA